MALSGVSYDRPAYAPGDTMTVEVVGEWFRTVEGTAHAADGSTLSGASAVIDPVEFTDQAGREYTLVSNDGQTAVFTAQA